MREYSATVRWFGLVALALGCQTPTSMTFRVSTDLACSPERDVLAWVQPETRPFDAESPTGSKRCETAGGARSAVGSIVALPDADEGIVVFAQFALSTDDAQPDCKTDGPGCIVARRRLGFLPGEALEVDVALSVACSGVICDPQDTCANGACVPATIDPTKCRGRSCTEADLGNDGRDPVSPTTTSVSSSASSSASSTSASSSGSSASTSSSSASTSSGEGGAGGAGGAGGSGGAGGEGGGPPQNICAERFPHRLALGTSTVCLASDTNVRCRGGVFDAGADVITNDFDSRLRCVEELDAEGDQFCARVGRGQNCSLDPVYCWTGQSALGQTSITDPIYDLAVGRGNGGALAFCTSGLVGGNDVVDCVTSTVAIPPGQIDRGASVVCGWTETAASCNSTVFDTPWAPPLGGGCALDGRAVPLATVSPDAARVCFSYSIDRVNPAGFSCARVEQGSAFPEAQMVSIPARQIAVGNDHVCGIVGTGRDARVQCSGQNNADQLGALPDAAGIARPELPEAPVEIVAEGRGTCARLADERVFCWGSNVGSRFGSGARWGLTVPVPQLVSFGQ